MNQKIKEIKFHFLNYSDMSSNYLIPATQHVKESQFFLN